jgi:uncharacterized protein YecE (DUF72 family)
VRHDSFRTPDFTALLRDHGVAAVLAADSDYPQIADITAPFIYARIMGTQEAEPLGYSKPALDLWAHRTKNWATGGGLDGFETISPQKAGETGRDVYLYVISGHKVRNPAAARALIERLG